jgi:hypothetical protein
LTTHANKQLLRQRYDAFQKQVKLLQDVHGYKPENIKVKWECVWRLERQTDEVAKFFNENPVRPLERLQPQSSIRGALNDAYVLQYSVDNVKENGHERLIAADLSSLFPFAALITSFPVGRYFNLVGNEIDESKVSYGGNEFRYGGTLYSGLLQVRVVPPAQLLHPFLLTTVNKQCLAVLCRTCAEELLQGPCAHDDPQRALTDVWTSVEITYAVVHLGYRVLAYFEMMLYSESAPILEKFTTVLAFNKIRFAALPPGTTDLERHCEKINAEMRFEERIGRKLTPADLEPKSLGRMFVKKALVCWIGCFSANLDKRTETKFVDNVDYLYLLASRQRIVDISLINQRYVQVVTKGGRPEARDSFNVGDNCRSQVSRKSCVTIGAMVTSIGRIIIHEHMMKLVRQHGARILKVCCDALYFTLPPTVADPLSYSESFGHWKQIYPGGKLISICSLGVQNFAVLYESGDRLVSEAKASGLTLNNVMTKKLDFSVYLDAVHQLISDKLFTPKRYQQVRRRSNAKTLTSTLHRKHYSFFSTNILSRRAISKESKNTFVTKPYGWRNT